MMYQAKNSPNSSFIFTKKLILAAILVSFLSAFLGLALKHITEHYEAIFFLRAENNWIFFLVFPIFGLSLIYFLRYYLFKKKSNQGITEIFACTQFRSKTLPIYKIPSHFLNGLITVVFGGSTGIEVSTVVATAAIGNVVPEKETIFKKYKTELICTGITAGITVLFGSPIAGILFSIEVITKKLNKTFFLTNGIAIVIASALLLFFDEKALFTVALTTWHYHAIPYFILLGVLAGVNSVYLTKTVLFFKSKFSKLKTQFHKILIGSAILSVGLLVLPQLYGDGYHAIKEIFANSTPAITLTWFATLIGIIVLKPILTSATLAAGGDGGVFAPSLFIGAFLGLFVASILNTYFHSNVIPINFMIIGMAAVLSASIQAPFTALFLVCGMINDYTLFFPILMVSLIAKYTSKKIFPYTVYNYSLVNLKS
ncbi:MAG TPA: chloride channel protein [Flavobacterium sp.]|nr:chloride channel protein [Flavobacterium sp.]